MATVNVTGHHSLVATAAVSAGIRATIDITTGYASACGANQKCIGTFAADVATAADRCTVIGLPSFIGKATLAITKGSEIYPSASGRVTGISTTLQLLGFNPHEAAAAVDDEIEIVPVIPAVYIA